MKVYIFFFPKFHHGKEVAESNGNAMNHHMVKSIEQMLLERLLKTKKQFSFKLTLPIDFQLQNSSFILIMLC
jgi:hypothetical protein